ncbi:MAG: T9SS type A sorting domain-containing protein, partial [Bacteroidota bacterium]
AVPEIGRVGQVDARTPFDAAGYCAPAIIQTTDGPLLLIGTQGGHLEAYFISQNLQDTFFLTDARWGGLDVGNRSHPALADLDSDGILEMALGNARGGLTIYKTVLQDCSVSATEPPASGPELKISPNPVLQWARIEWQGHSNASWRAFNALGQLTAEGKLDASTGYLDVKTWPSGVYFIEAVSGRERQSGRLVKQ